MSRHLERKCSKCGEDHHEGACLRVTRGGSFAAPSGSVDAWGIETEYGLTTCVRPSQIDIEEFLKSEYAAWTRAHGGKAVPVTITKRSPQNDKLSEVAGRTPETA